MSTTPTVPDVNNTQKEILDAGKAPVPTPEPAPAPAPLPEGVQTLEKRTDGSYYMKLVTGEEFTGSELQVMGEVGKSKVETRKWADALRNKANEPVTPSAPPLSPEEQQQQQLREYLVEEHAKALGFSSGKEYREEVTRVRDTASNTQDQNTATEFQLICPDFPNTKEAADKLINALDHLGIVRKDERPTARQLAAAHAWAIHNNVYKPLTADEQRATMQAAQPVSRPTPAPMVAGTQPETTSAAGDLWGMPLNDLRKAAMGR